MKTLLKSIFVGLALLGAHVAVAVATDSTAAPGIMQKVAESYAALSSYQDVGIVYTHDPSKDQPDQILFRTWFARPERFRFEWTTHHPYPPLRHLTNDWVVWTDANGAHLLGLGKQKDGTLSFAVAGATGVSRGASHHIPGLLLRAIGGASLVRLMEVRLVDEESFEGTACFHLLGNSGGGSYGLWVGKADYLIRRIMREILGKPVEEIHREIQTNREIANGAFGRRAG